MAGSGRQRLIVAAILGGAALLFAGGAAFYITSKSDKIGRQADMLAEAPGQMAEGERSTLFRSPDAGQEDITGYHPAYLLGAFTTLFIGGSPCKSGHVHFDVTVARCEWPTGSVLIYSNTMPAALAHAKPNRFNDQGLPLDPKGNIASRGAYNLTTNATSLELSSSDRAQLERFYGPLLVGLTGHNPQEIGQNGGWFSAKEQLGYRTCWVYKNATNLNLDCFEKG